MVLFFISIVPTVSGLQRFTSEGSSPFSRGDTTRPSESKPLRNVGKMQEKVGKVRENWEESGKMQEKCGENEGNVGNKAGKMWRKSGENAGRRWEK